jgi:hypothetical protein
LNGTPVAMGVVNRFDSEMMILCGSPFASLTARKPSAPAPPDLLTTISGSFISLYLMTMPCSRRAIWSAPPPVPAGITNSTGLAGSHASAGVAPASARAAAASALVPWVRAREMMLSIMLSPVEAALFLNGIAVEIPVRQCCAPAVKGGLTMVNFSQIPYSG